MIVLPLLVVLVVLFVNLWRRRTEGTLAMAGATAAWTPTAVVRVPLRWPTIRALGTGESRRLVTHPLVVTGLGIGIMTSGLAGNPTDVYFTLTGAGSAALFLPPLIFLTATLATTRARRAGAEDLVASTASSDVDRTLAMGVAGLVVAAGVLSGVVVAYTAYRTFGVDMRRSPGPLELLPLPLSALGAVTLGTMVGRWLPYRGVGPVALVLLVGVTGTLAGDLTGNAELFAPFVELIPYDQTGDPGVPTRTILGHDLYLLGLDGMALIGAVLHDRRTLRWWALGFVAVVFTAAMGAWQLS